MFQCHFPNLWPDCDSYEEPSAATFLCVLTHLGQGFFSLGHTSEWALQWVCPNLAQNGNQSKLFKTHMPPPQKWHSHCLQGASVSGGTPALAGDVVTGGSVLALALLVAVVAVGAGVAALLAAPALEARGAVAGPSDGVAQGPVLALAAAAAVGSPVVAVTCWSGRGRKVQWF